LFYFSGNPSHIIGFCHITTRHLLNLSRIFKYSYDRNSFKQRCVEYISIIVIMFIWSCIYINIRFLFTSYFIFMKFEIRSSINFKSNLFICRSNKFNRFFSKIIYNLRNFKMSNRRRDIIIFFTAFIKTFTI